MDIVANALTNGTEITFSVLFIALFLWEIKTSKEREDKLNDTITEMTKALNWSEDMKELIARIAEKVGL